MLIDCVDGGASVSFMSPLPFEKASASGAAWRKARRASAAPRRGGRAGIVGTVQLILDQPENQPHRADLSKMLVHRRARRRGVGAAILRAAEEAAREFGKTLLVLDTASADAERLYARLGWVRVGVVPGYALCRAAVSATRRSSTAARIENDGVSATSCAAGSQS